MRAAFTKVWPGGEHAFRLGIGELRAIEQRSDAGCAVVMMRLMSSTWKIDDVIAPIRLGLVGAGMAEKDAQRLVDTVLADKASLYALAIPAADILREFIMWDGEDQPGEAPAGTVKTEPRYPMDEPDGQATTEPAP
ncbi:MAG: gene transfer agent family protein [Mesorhizobium sp.]